MKTLAPAKVADIRFRVELKQHSGIVVYKVRSSADTDDYEVTLVNGKISSCTCPAHRRNGVFCYIMRDVLAKELEYQERKASEEKATMDTFAAEIVAEAEKQVAVAPTTSERMSRSSLNRRELNIVNGIPMR